MQQVLFENVLSKTQTQTKEVRNTTADILRFMRGLQPLKVTEITLTGPIRPSSPQYEVVAPAVYKPRFTPMVVLRTAEMARNVQQKAARKRGTFGRGQLHVV